MTLLIASSVQVFKNAWKKLFFCKGKGALTFFLKYIGGFHSTGKHSKSSGLGSGRAKSEEAHSTNELTPML